MQNEKNIIPANSLRSSSSKRIIITGGPGVGKTSILLALEQAGEYVVKEAATDFIMYRQALGISSPWEEMEAFQLGIVNLQLQREQRMPTNVDRIFLDRGCHDGLAYLDPEMKAYATIETISRTCQYDMVFLIEPLDHCKTTQVRREDKQEALLLSKKMEKIYKDFGFDPITIKKGPLEQRVEDILQELKNREADTQEQEQVLL